MERLLSKARHHLAEEEVSFVLDTLAGNDAERNALLELLGDPSAIDVILDDERLHEALTQRVDALRISARLFFYILLRRSFCRAGLTDRDMAEYVACVLAEQVRRESFLFPFRDRTAPMLYSVDYATALNEASAGRQFFLHASAGNHYLFMTGVFGAFIEERRHRRGAPGIAYYEGIGRSAYHQASRHRLAREYDLVSILETLSEAFPEARTHIAEVARAWTGAAA